MNSIPASYLIDPEGTIIRIDLRWKGPRRDPFAGSQTAGGKGQHEMIRVRTPHLPPGEFPEGRC